MNATITIRNANAVLPGGVVPTDVLVEHGKIAALGQGLQPKGEIIDATGLILLPGVIDPQVHFREPGLTHKEDLHTGSRAAAAGGVTSFLDMPNNKPAITTRQLMAEKKQSAAQNCVVNYGFFIGATPDNLEELNAVENVCGIKIFMGSSTGSLLVDKREDLEKIFANGSRLIAVHAEDEGIMNDNRALMGDNLKVSMHPRIRDEAAALKATTLAVELSLKYQRRLHILHLTTAEETELLRRLPANNRISTEVCPQHFILTAPDCYQRLGTLAQMNPPLRTQRHADALWQGLKDGVINCIATDHAPHTLEEKNQPYGTAPSGMPGVETSLPLMLNRVNQGLCNLQDIARWMCDAPARLYGMIGKGRIEVGYDADLVLVDLALKKTITRGQLFTKVGWSPYEGMSLQGWPVRTMVHGQTVFLNGQILEGIRGQELRFDSSAAESTNQRR
ncbi:MAG: dihydroorotase [SAR324 cluster bacterium]|nr:dihydroorotase [SAR324 cluster bacterium]